MNQRRLFLTVISIALLSCISSFAQKNQLFNQVSNLLQLENNTVFIENFSFTDQLNESGQMQHTAIFELSMNNDPVSHTILENLQVALKERGRACTFISLNSTNQVSQSRLYENLVVEEITLPVWDATSNIPARARIKLRAGGVSILKENAKFSIPVRTKNLSLCSNFALSLGSLPCTRVMKISGLTIKPGTTQVQNFTIELSAIDGAAWNQWFLTGAGGIKKEQGYIRLFAANLKDVNYTLSLMDVEITSYTASSANQQGVARVTIGLRVKGVAIK